MTDDVGHRLIEAALSFARADADYRQSLRESPAYSVGAECDRWEDAKALLRLRVLEYETQRNVSAPELQRQAAETEVVLQHALYVIAGIRAALGYEDEGDEGLIDAVHHVLERAEQAERVLSAPAAAGGAADARKRDAGDDAKEGAA